MGGIAMWIARDENGSLWLFSDKPYKYKGMWRSNSIMYRIHEKLFPEVKWEDKEPRELILK